MIDNSDIQTKIKVRQKGASLINSPLFVLEMYGGEGVITKSFWVKKSKHITVYEKEKGKFKFNHPDVNLIEKCNTTIEDFSQYNVIDLDAYGLVQQRLKDVRIRCNYNSVLFFTEFNPFSQIKKHDWQSKFCKFLNSLNPTAYYIEKSKYSQAIYGYIYINT